MPANSPSARWSLLSLGVVAVAALYWLMLVTATHWPQEIPGLDNGWADKVVHFAAYCVLAFVTASAWRVFRGRLSRWSLVALVMGIAVFGAVDELTQALPVINRSCSPYDWTADVGGATLGTIVFATFVNGRNSLPASEQVAATH